MKQNIQTTSNANADKRDLVLQLTAQAGQRVKRCIAFDRIGPVRVTHQGATTNILWGNLLLETLQETEPARIAERIINRVKCILDEPFDSLAF